MNLKKKLKLNMKIISVFSNKDIPKIKKLLIKMLIKNSKKLL